MLFLFFFHTRWVGWVGFEKYGKFHTFLFFIFDAFPKRTPYIVWNVNIDDGKTSDFSLESLFDHFLISVSTKCDRIVPPNKTRIVSRPVMVTRCFGMERLTQNHLAVWKLILMARDEMEGTINWRNGFIFFPIEARSQQRNIEYFKTQLRLTN